MKFLNQTTKLLLFISAFVTNISLAQDFFQPGYFVDNSGTKKQCLIKNEDWLKSPESFIYKTEENGSTQKGELNNVAEFEVGDFHYIRYIVNIDLSSNTIDNMSIVKEPAFTTKTLYLRKISGGILTLYSANYANVNRFFVSKEGSDPEQLVYKPYRTAEGILYNKMYIGQLYTLMKEKFSNTEDFKRINYNATDLAKLFNKYNGNTTDKTNAGLKLNRGDKLNIGIYAGASTLNVKNNVPLTKEDFAANGTSVAAGIDLQWTLPVNNNKWAVFIAPGIEILNSKKSIRGYSDASFTEYTSSIKLKYSAINLPIGGRHNIFINKQTKVTLSAAFIFAFVNKKNEVTYNRVFDNPSITGLNLKSPTSYNSSYFLSAAYFYKNAGIELRYTAKKQITPNNSYIITNYSAWSALVHYKIF